MSITKSVITCGFSAGLRFDPSRMSRLRVLSLHYSSSFSALRSGDRSSLWGINGRWRLKEDPTDKRKVKVRSIMEPGGPQLPSEPPFNFINWIVGVTITIVLPFFFNKWASLNKLKDDVENTVETIEEIVEVVEKVTGEVEKVAEDISEDLPEGGSLRKAVDFVEHVAERANRDAHLVGEFIDKVEEIEGEVEKYVGSLGDEHATSHIHIDHHHKDYQEKDGANGTHKEE